MINTIRQLIRDTRSQKLRTILTLFGIIWGTAAVSLLLAFGNGLYKQFVKSSRGIGDNVVIGWPRRTSMPFEGLTKVRYILMDDNDIQLLRQKTHGLDAISVEYQARLRLQHAATVLSVRVSGVEPVFGEIRNLIPTAGGRFINHLDQEKRRRVAFLGDRLASQIFGEESPIGHSIQLHGFPFLVIGVLNEKIQNESYSGRDNRKVFIPSSTLKVMTGQRFISNFVFSASDVTKSKALMNDIRKIMALQHRFDPEDDEAIEFWDTTNAARFLHTFILALNIFLGTVGCLTLVVGGIGVSNIMNVVVEERTREIGIKMALGAKPRVILGQFVFETLAMTIVGGILGILITLGICRIFPAFELTEYIGDPAISPGVAAAVAVMLGLIGLISGYFPARTASNLDPVVAMKM